MTIGRTDRITVLRRDRPWVNAYVAVVLGPFDMPTTDDLRGAVSQIAQSAPHSRLAWRFDDDMRHWVDDRSPEDVVVEGHSDVLDPGDVLDAISVDASLRPPLTLIRYPRHIGMKMCHALGDGQAFLFLPAAVLHTAIEGRPVPWPVQRSARMPLAAAALATFGKNPKRIKAAMSDRVAVPADEPSGASAPWESARRTRHASILAPQMSELLEWKQRSAASASRFAVYTLMVLKAFARAGLYVSQDVRVVVDLRRYLGWRHIPGNFIAGVPVNISSQMDPEQISEQIRATNASGRPLAGYMLTTMRGMTASPEIDEVDTLALPRVTFSNLGQVPAVESLPFRDDSPVVMTGSVPPEGPLGITILFGETRGTLSVVAIFHDNVVPVEVVNHAIELVVDDPVGVICGLATED